LRFVDCSPVDFWFSGHRAVNPSADEAPIPPEAEAEERYQEALAAITFYLGNAWLAKELEGVGGHDYLMLGGPDTDGPGDRSLRLFRTQALANSLHLASDVRGFGRFLASIRSRSMAEAVAELRAVNDIRSRGGDVELLDATRTLDKSPEAKFTLNGQQVWVEVKSKYRQQGSTFRASTVTNSLRKARAQLPAGGPGIVYLDLPSAWCDRREVLEGTNRAIEDSLRNTRRVSAVVVMLERRIFRPGEGVTFIHANYAIVNPNPRTPLRG